MRKYWEIERYRKERNEKMILQNFVTLRMCEFDSLIQIRLRITFFN